MSWWKFWEGKPNQLSISAADYWTSMKPVERRAFDDWIMEGDKWRSQNMNDLVAQWREWRLKRSQ